MIQPGADSPGPELPPSALLVTSMRPTAPLILLNVSMGDEARVGDRRCGCPLERVGVDASSRGHPELREADRRGDDLPRRRRRSASWKRRCRPASAEGPTDYQLVEEEAPGGEARLRAPRASGRGAGGRRGAADGVPRRHRPGLRRRAGDGRPLAASRTPHDRAPSGPGTTALGKIQHLHVERRAAQEDGRFGPTGGVAPP